MSMRLPLRAKAGRLAVTMTAATFLVPQLGLSWSRVLTPSRSSIPISDCRVNTALSSRSPVPFRPDHQAVADQLVLAHALDVGDVLYADLAERRGRACGSKSRAASRRVRKGMGVFPARSGLRRHCPAHVDASASWSASVVPALSAQQNRDFAWSAKRGRGGRQLVPVWAGRSRVDAVRRMTSVGRVGGHAVPGGACRRRWPPPRGGGFAVAGRTRPAAGGVPSRRHAAPAVDGMLLLQQMEDGPTRDRQARRHGRAMLDGLAALQHARCWAARTGSPDALARLAVLGGSIARMRPSPALRADAGRRLPCAPGWSWPGERS